MVTPLSQIPPSLISARIAQRIRAIAIMDKVPVRTGELRRSIHASPYADGSIVGTNKAYAIWVHDPRKGGKKIKPVSKKALHWKGAKGDVVVKWSKTAKTNGKPFLTEAVAQFVDDADTELPALFPDLSEAACLDLGMNLRMNGLQVTTA